MGQLNGIDIKACHHIADGAVFKLHCACNVSGCLHRQHLACTGAYHHFAMGYGIGVHAGNGAHRPQHIHKSCQVVGTHIVHGAAALGIIKVRIGVERLPAVAEHKGSEAYGLAYKPVSHGLAHGLYTGAKESVGRTANIEALFFGKGDKLLPLPEAEAQRFFGVHVLARFKSAAANLIVCLGNGEIYYQVKLV